MAGIDKIVGTPEQGRELRAWVGKTFPELLDYFHLPREPIGSNGLYTICNLPHSIDIVLWAKCPIEWVRDRLKVQYGEQGP